MQDFEETKDLYIELPFDSDRAQALWKAMLLADHIIKDGDRCLMIESMTHMSPEIVLFRACELPSRFCDGTCS